MGLTISKTSESITFTKPSKLSVTITEPTTLRVTHSSPSTLIIKVAWEIKVIY